MVDHHYVHLSSKTTRNPFLPEKNRRKKKEKGKEEERFEREILEEQHNQQSGDVAVSKKRRRTRTLKKDNEACLLDVHAYFVTKAKKNSQMVQNWGHARTTKSTYITTAM